MTPTPSKANKRTEAQKDADLAFIEHWATMGKTERDIATLLNAERAKCQPPYTLSRSQVRQDIMKVRALWREEMNKDHSDFVAAELKGLERQENELWKAWARSQEAGVIKTTEKSPAPATGNEKPKRRLLKVGKTTIRTQFQTGEAAYMNLILQCREQRRSLLGLDQPKRTEITGADGGAIIVAQAQFDPAAVRGPAPVKPES